jgi:putative transposase
MTPHATLMNVTDMDTIPHVRQDTHELSAMAMPRDIVKDGIGNQAVFNWIKKYTTLMQTYLNRITPNVGNAWRTDKLYVKFKGNMKYMYALMDDETRFWIAQQVADTKFTADVRPLFRKAKEIAGKRPTVLISDGARNYDDAYRHEFATIRSPRTRHIRHIRLQGDHNNNKMERLNGEVRDRRKL